MPSKNASIYWRKQNNWKQKNLRKNQTDPDSYFEKMQFFSKAGRSLRHILNNASIYWRRLQQPETEKQEEFTTQKPNWTTRDYYKV